VTDRTDSTDSTSSTDSNDTGSNDLDGLDLVRLRSYFADNIPGATGDPLSASLISGGKSNLTYSVSDGSSTWVLRRPPMGHVLPTAHDMAREYTVINALGPTPVPVPIAYVFCDDLDVNGAPFYVMEMVEGRIARTGADLTGFGAVDARRCSEQLVDVLAAIHHVDWAEVGLSDFGRPDGYLARQVRRWNQQWEGSKEAGCPDVPAITELARRLANSVPESSAPTIVHGDYRLDNTMLAADDPGTVVAVLDWEMSTLGDPLADLGLFLLYWGRDDSSASAVSGAAISTDLGFMSRDEIVERYEKATKIDLESLEWYEVFAAYKLAVIVAGIHARFLMGMTRGDGFDGMGEMVRQLSEAALARADVSSVKGLRA
jgi:aminoglycoside phosphotransferase (APT) family kinase protein